MTLGAGGLGTTPLGGNGPTGSPAPSNNPGRLLYAEELIRIVVVPRDSDYMQSFSNKHPADVDTFTFDFVRWLATGETINADAAFDLVQYNLEGQADSDTVVMKSGATGVSGSQVTQGIQGGVDGVTYKALCTITTNTGRQRTVAGKVKVKSL